MIFFSILILIVAIALPSINNNISSNIYIRISSVILLYSGLLALNAINIPALGSGIGLFSGLFHVTFISQLTDFFIFLIGSIILIAWPVINSIKFTQKLISNRLINKFKKINVYSTEYSLIILFSTLGGSLLVSSADIVSMYLSIELQSFGLYILSTIFRDSDTATSAGFHFGKMKYWLKLSNSGEPLKLLLPSNNWKVISGWTNYSCMVIIQKISEKLMGNRGSKSNLFTNFVKEQRVDGSLCFMQKHIRYTLMDFERNYQVKIPSKQLNIKQFSTFHIYSKLNPWFVSGLIDGEGCFTVQISKSKTNNLRFKVEAIFRIELHSRDLDLLLELQEYFGGCGSISKYKTRNLVKYSVSSIKDLNEVIIPHFTKYPLLTQKLADFNLFKQIVELMNSKAHLTIEGLNQIINIKASMNLGISKSFKDEFTNLTPVARPLINTNKIPDSNWLSGFVTGEGCFLVTISNSKRHKTGKQVNLTFKITQHERDKNLMELIINYLNCGRLFKIGTCFDLRVSKFSDVIEKILPFFENIQLKE